MKNRILLALIVAGALAGLLPGGSVAQQPQAKPGSPKRPEPTLKVGDPAPALKADKWWQGDAVTAFEPGKVYVVEFWADWCSLCKAGMPHMAQLQAEYKDKGVTFIAYSAKDPKNSAEQVAAFVAKRGPKWKYRFAYSDSRETYDAWVKAAGQGGLPSYFVVGKDSKLAYIGLGLSSGIDIVLRKVVDGTWKNDEGLAEVQRARQEYFTVRSLMVGRGDPAARLRAIEEFEAKHTGMVSDQSTFFNTRHFATLFELKKADEAKKVAERKIAHAIKWSNPGALSSLSRALRTGAGGDKELLALAVKAAEAAAVASGEEPDHSALLNLATMYQAAGDKAKANEYADKAVAATAKASPEVKSQVEQEAKKIKGEGK
jgi:thiol-disulfide isomerase/thioredoxin